MLTYCMNIHPTQTYDEVLASLNGPVRAVKDGFSPDAVFPIGLRLSAETARMMRAEDKAAEFGALMDEIGLAPVTMNGFPYGPFHGTRVKEEVYLPDWRSESRIGYTSDMIALMSELNGEGAFLSISTVPGAFRPTGQGAEAAIAENYLASVAEAINVGREKGQVIALAIEPEPYCLLETIDETIRFFETHLFSPDAVARLAALTGLGKVEAEAALRRHIGLCYDVCHAAVEFEDAADNIAKLSAAGIEIHKLQLSSALRISEGSAEMRDALAPFNEPTYLHQLVAKGPSGLRRFSDLPEALAPGGAADGEEWRVHFHVPVYVDALEKFDSTQFFLKEILGLHRDNPISPHLEIETYTWDVLPSAMRAPTIEDDILRELRWVQETLDAA